MKGKNILCDACSENDFLWKKMFFCYLYFRNFQRLMEDKATLFCQWSGQNQSSLRSCFCFETPDLNAKLYWWLFSEGLQICVKLSKGLVGSKCLVGSKALVSACWFETNWRKSRNSAFLCCSYAFSQGTPNKYKWWANSK